MERVALVTGADWFVIIFLFNDNTLFSALVTLKRLEHSSVFCLIKKYWISDV